MITNVIMAFWFFSSAVVWGSEPIWVAALIALPSTLAVIALALRNEQ